MIRSDELMQIVQGCYLVDLRDDTPKWKKTSIAELSRPNHAEKEFICQKKTHTQGCKWKHEHKDAVYHN